MTAVLLAAAGIAAAAPLALLLWANRTLVAVDVVGHSMEPAFHHGDRVLVRRVPAKRLRVGDVAVLGRPDTGDLRDLALIMGSVPPWVVKRVAALPGDPVPASVPARGGTVPPGHLVVLGDNTGHSTDSRVWGPVPDDRVLGVVLRRMTSPRTPAA
ncbi:S26 family signal peptidase [Nocardiopsis changdeensis]|uniref:signal peptidase I n=1 Tax=Nocardiopsis changdeensis TaxID=2831969 RepID=A0ABX8BL49_9ACTN|nr:MULTISPECIES: S26 family signal peptidase [Nocardiopsis]QUX22794.1 S26 family signal peptidase [Nocardiopsis changdeensis]QYX38736.1 S26 family signal peptidase [Nocardiopsis sp. MT53]